MRAVFEARWAKVGETKSHYRGCRITSTVAARDWAKRHLSDYFDERCDAEEFMIATLNTKNQVIRVVRITRGTLSSSLVHPREVFRPAITDCAACILLIHNHPSGDSTPSREDHEVTERLTKAGELLGIQVLDHLIVGDTVTSIRETN